MTYILVDCSYPYSEGETPKEVSSRPAQGIILKNKNIWTVKCKFVYLLNMHGLRCDLNVLYVTSSRLCYIFNQQMPYPELSQKGFLHIMPPYKTVYICPNVLFIYFISLFLTRVLMYI